MTLLNVRDRRRLRGKYLTAILFLGLGLLFSSQNGVAQDQPMSYSGEQRSIVITLELSEQAKAAATGVVQAINPYFILAEWEGFPAQAQVNFAEVRNLRKPDEFLAGDGHSDFVELDIPVLDVSNSFEFISLGIAHYDTNDEAINSWVGTGWLTEEGAEVMRATSSRRTTVTRLSKCPGWAPDYGVPFTSVEKVRVYWKVRSSESEIKLNIMFLRRDPSYDQALPWTEQGCNWCGLCGPWKYLSYQRPDWPLQIYFRGIDYYLKMGGESDREDDILFMKLKLDLPDELDRVYNDPNNKVFEVKEILHRQVFFSGEPPS